MRKQFIALGVASVLVAANAAAAGKAEVSSRIETVRAAVEGFAAKAPNAQAAIADIEAARGYVRQAADALEKGKTLFGAVKPDAEQDIRHLTTMAELNITLAEARLAKFRGGEELAALKRQSEKVSARLKVFEEKKAAVEKLRADAAKAETLSREVGALRTDKALLVSQVEMLMAEHKQFDALKAEKAALSRQVDELTEEKRRLVEQVEKLTGQHGSGAVKGEPSGRPSISPAEGKPLSHGGKPEQKQPKTVATGSDRGREKNPLSELVPEMGEVKSPPVKPKPAVKPSHQVVPAAPPVAPARPALQDKGPAAPNLGELVAPQSLEKAAPPAAEAPAVPLSGAGRAVLEGGGEAPAR